MYQNQQSERASPRAFLYLGVHTVQNTWFVFCYCFFAYNSFEFIHIPRIPFSLSSYSFNSFPIPRLTIAVTATLPSPNKLVKLSQLNGFVRKKRVQNKNKGVQVKKYAHCSADALAATATVLLQASNDILSLIANINNLERERARTTTRASEYILHNTYTHTQTHSIYVPLTNLFIQSVCILCMRPCTFTKSTSLKAKKKS